MSNTKIDVGHGVMACVLRTNGEIDCVEWEHDCPNGASPDRIPARPYWATGWELLSEASLTLSPSLLCTGCGRHGFLREGKWAPA